MNIMIDTMNWIIENKEFTAAIVTAITGWIIAYLRSKKNTSKNKIINKSTINYDNSTTINNFHNYDKIIKNYTTIYKFHKEDGEKYFDDLNNENDSTTKKDSYIKKVKNLTHPKEVTIQDLIYFIFEVERGDFAWANELKNEKESFLSKTKEIKHDIKTSLIKKVSSEAKFPSLGREHLISISKELRRINDDNLEKESIGGIISTLETNRSFHKENIYSPELLGFKKIKSEESLINYLLKGQLKISNITLNSTENRYKIKFNLINDTSNDITCIIPKGQIFENKIYKNKTQNLATTKSEEININKKVTISVKVDAFCLNRNFENPEGGLGNITIFKIYDDSFESQKDLWQILDEINSK